MVKALVAYFSRKGENSVNGRIETLKIGNTAVVAEKVRGFTHGDIFEIRTKAPYPISYNECTVVAKKELLDEARPELELLLPDLNEYDKIYLGYPNWWGTMPMAVFTFLESYDFSGKTIYPFCTNEGSDMGKSELDIKKLCPDATLYKGLAIRGSVVRNCDRDIREWLGIEKKREQRIVIYR